MSIEIENFASFGLHPTLVASLTAMQFDKPTPIQAETIPHALLGKDVMGTAQTGTGKTGAYGIPLVHFLLSTDKSVLVLAPTRELATQIHAMLRLMLGKNSPIFSALLIGGDPMVKQFNQLSRKPRLVVGTPGRINDHLTRRTLKLEKSAFLVLDECDRMLDMGFLVQLEQIAESLPEKRQTLMFSATMEPSVLKIAQSLLKDPIRISVGSTHNPVAKIIQENVRTNENDKYNILMTHLNKCNGSFVVFVKTKFGAEKLAKRLRTDGQEAVAMHGDLRQNARDRIIRDFRNMLDRILVATDIAARGLDIPHIEYVVNYDIPQCPEDFIHRIGRTGRAGAEGHALSLITPEDGLRWRNICRLINPDEKPEPFSRRPQGGGNRRGNGGGYGGGRSNFSRDRNSFDAPRREFGGAPFRSRSASSEGQAPRRDRDNGGFRGADASAPRRDGGTLFNKGGRSNDGASAPRRDRETGSSFKGRGQGSRQGGQSSGRGRREDFSGRTH